MPVVGVTAGQPITEAWGDSVSTSVAALESADTAHAAAADPHTGYRLESANHTHASSGLQAGQVAHAALTGLTTGDDHTQYQKESERGAVNGYAALDASGKVPAAQLPAGAALVHTINFVVDGSGVVIATGIKGSIQIDYAATITKWTLLADQSGSIVVDVWRDSYANFPPTVADSICGTGKPTITTALKASAGVGAWASTAIAAGDILRFNVDSATTITRVTIALTITRT